jgi:hypothetical protein
LDSTRFFVRMMLRIRASTVSKRTPRRFSGLAFVELPVGQRRVLEDRVELPQPLALGARRLVLGARPRHRLEVGRPGTGLGVPALGRMLRDRALDRRGGFVELAEWG